MTEQPLTSSSNDPISSVSSGEISSDSLHNPYTVSPDNLSLSGIQSLVSDPEIVAQIQDCDNRSHLLPALFRLRGKPYSMEDYPQFNVFYSREYVSDLIIMSGRQSGKSQNLCNSEVLDSIQIPHFQTLYVAPLQSQTQRFSTQLLVPTINSCSLARYLQATDMKLSDSAIVKAVFHQSFANGAGIQLGYAKTSADRLRGITVDRIDFDELQDQVIDNIPIIKESLTTSQWKVCRYTGTAKTLDNTIERTWQQSSRCEWVMKCDSCNYYNIPDDDEDCRCLRMVQADGIHCLKCGSALNARNGEWVAKHPDRHNTFRGYHISQVILPANLEDPMRWNAIIQKLSTLDITTIKNEVLGISSSTGVRIITPEDIRRNSVLPEMRDILKLLATRKLNYAYIVSGVDWGGAERTSFTVHVIIGVKRDGCMDILYARRYVGFDPDTRLAEIAKAHYTYNANFMVADFGMGFDLNVMLIHRFGIRMVQMQFTANQRSMMHYSPRQGYPCWALDKVTALTTMFIAIKNDQFSFPKAGPHTEGGFDHFTQDLLSPYEEVVDKGYTEKRQYTRDPAVPDDFAMALCYASTGAYYVMFNGDITKLIPRGTSLGAHTLSDSSFDIGQPIDPRDVLNARI